MDEQTRSVQSLRAVAQAAKNRDPDSKRFRGGPLRPGGGSRGGSCCNVNVRWLAAGFVFGMLVFATLSVLQVLIMLRYLDRSCYIRAQSWLLLFCSYSIALRI